MERRVVLVDFIEHVVTHHKIKGDELSRMMSALRSRWVQACASVSVFEDPSVVLAKRAGKAATVREVHAQKESRRQLPVTADLIKIARDQYWVKSGDLDRHMTYIGIVLAFNFMWRISEYVADGRSEAHAIRTEDVLFLREHKEPWRSWELKDLKDGREVISVLFVIRSSKTGAGRYLYLTRKSVAESEAVDDVIEWAAASGSHRGDPFLARRRLGQNGQWDRLKLTRRMMNGALKHLAVEAGFVGLEHAFASRSLRIGGATAMIAAGKSRGTSTGSSQAIWIDT